MIVIIGVKIVRQQQMGIGAIGDDLYRVWIVVDDLADTVVRNPRLLTSGRVERFSVVLPDHDIVDGNSAFKLHGVEAKLGYSTCWF